VREHQSCSCRAAREGDPLQALTKADVTGGSARASDEITVHFMAISFGGVSIKSVRSSGGDARTRRVTRRGGTKNKKKEHKKKKK